MPELSKEQLYIILGVICIILIGCVIGIYNQNSGQKQSSPACRQAWPVSSPASAIVPLVASAGQPAQIYVHVSGAVIKEGVYRLNKGDRLIDLIKLSGATVSADLDNINLAEPLTDGQKICVPKKTVNIASNQFQATAGKSAKSNKIVNINTADEKGLDSLPGIGPAMAKRIVDYRNEKGKFSNIEELKEVPGISEKKFEKLKSCISVY